MLPGKPLDQMTPAERDDYLKREQAWLKNQYDLGGKRRLIRPAPPAPDKDSPLYDAPVRPDMPRDTLNPRQVRNQAIASARDTRHEAMQAARAMKDSGQRLSAKQAAFDAYADARKTAQQQYQQSKLGPRTGGPGIDSSPTNTSSFLKNLGLYGMKKGGSVKKYKAGGSVKPSKMGSVKTASPKMSSASKRGDGIAQRGKTRGKMV